MGQKYISPAQAEARESATSKTGRKEQLVKVGCKLMMEKGIQNTSIEDITKACGFSKGSFYYYFTSKDDFLMAAIMGLNVDNAFNEASNRTDLAVSQRIVLYMRRYAEIMRDSIGIDFCRIWAELVIQYQNLERFHTDLKQVETLLNQGIQDGELSKDTDIHGAARVLLTYVYGAAFGWHIGAAENDVVTVTDLFAPLVETLLATYRLSENNHKES